MTSQPVHEAHSDAQHEPQTELGRSGTMSILKNDIRSYYIYIKTMIVYMTTLTALVLGLAKLNEPIKQIYEGRAWLLIAVAVLPITVALVFVAIPDALRYRGERRLAEQGVRGKLSRPGYFRITPYEDNPIDRERYAAADEAHIDVLAWLRHVEQPIQYLTGLSGTGKSSLLNAYILPELRNEFSNCRTIIVPRHDPLNALRNELLKPGVVWKKPPIEIQEIRRCSRRHPSICIRPGCCSSSISSRSS